MSTAVIARRRVRLAVIVSVACAVVAAGVTGVGLLLPGGSDGASIRLVGAFVALAAGGVLVRMDGAARGCLTLAVVSTTAAVVCLVTLPASPVTLSVDDDTAVGPDSDADGGVGGEITLEPESGDADATGDAVGLPVGGGIVVDDGVVVLTLPDGTRITIGSATIGGSGPDLADGGTTLRVVDGVVTRTDGGPIGPGVAVGGLTFERDDGSRVTVGDDRLHEVPPPLEAQEADSADPVDAVLALLLAAFALVAFAPPLVRVGERLPVSLLDDPRMAASPAPPPPASVEEGLADVLRTMLADPDPRTSVIGAYARLLTAMAEAGFPRRDEEGPHEHLWRTLGPLGVRRQPVHRLAELFVRARFTPLPVTDDDRQDAIGALADAVADLRLQASDVREAAAAVGVPT